MNPSTANRYALISWLIWTAGFLAFPIAGVAGGVVAGRVDNPIAAVVAGLITGAVIGTGQWLVSRGRLRPAAAGSWPRRSAWVPACCSARPPSASGTSLADVAVMGALTGAAPRRRPDRGATRRRPDDAGGGRWPCRCCGRSAGSSPPWPGSPSRSSSPSSAPAGPSPSPPSPGSSCSSCSPPAQTAEPTVNNPTVPPPASKDTA